MRLLRISDGVCEYLGVNDWPTFRIPIDRFEEEPPVTLTVVISAPNVGVIVVEETGEIVGVGDSPAEPVIKTKKEKK